MKGSTHPGDDDNIAGEILGIVTAGDVEFIWQSSVTGQEEQAFETDKALAALLIGEVVFLNSHWDRKDWPDEAKAMTNVIVNCSDVFAWACADSESLPFAEIETLYRMWRKDPSWGPAVWCCQQRKQMPQAAVRKVIEKAGIWNLATMNLAESSYDRICRERKL